MSFTQLMLNDEKERKKEQDKILAKHDAAEVDRRTNPMFNAGRVVGSQEGVARRSKKTSGVKELGYNPNHPRTVSQQYKALSNKHASYRDPKSTRYAPGGNKTSDVAGVLTSCDTKGKNRRLDARDSAEMKMIRDARRQSDKYKKSVPFRIKVVYQAGNWRELRFMHSRDAAERALSFASLIREGKCTVEMQKRDFKRKTWNTISTLHMKSAQDPWIVGALSIWVKRFNTNIKHSILSEVLR